MSTYLQKAIEIAGYSAIARACNVTPAAVRKWERKGLPRTEWTGETQYAAAIAKCVKQRVTKRQLLSERGATGAPGGAKSGRAVAEPCEPRTPAPYAGAGGVATRTLGEEVSCRP